MKNKRPEAADTLSENRNETAVKTVVLAYIGIVAVAVAWGVYPILTQDLLTYFSGSMFSLSTALISAVVLTLLCLPLLRRLDLSYLKIAVPTGTVLGLAALLQKIGLQYTTPTMYSFLENLSCVVVPILLFLFIRKIPNVLTVLAAVICLFACFLLSGVGFSDDGISFGVGNLLCGAAGILYGVNIAMTGAYAKKMNVFLYVTVQKWAEVVISVLVAVLLNFIRVDGKPLEPILFTWDVKRILTMALLVLGISTLGWLVRTWALKYVNASAVAVIMPFSAVVTGVTAVLVGKDTFTLPLLLGGILIIVSSVLSGFADLPKKKSKKDTEA